MGSAQRMPLRGTAEPGVGLCRAEAVGADRMCTRPQAESQCRKDTSAVFRAAWIAWPLEGLGE